MTTYFVTMYSAGGFSSVHSMRTDVALVMDIEFMTAVGAEGNMQYRMYDFVIYE